MSRNPNPNRNTGRGCDSNKIFVSLIFFSNLFLEIMISNVKSSSYDDLSAILIAQIF